MTRFSLAVHTLQTCLTRRTLPRAVSRRALSRGLLFASGLTGLACSDLSKQALPAGVPDPNSFNTTAGALALYNTARSTFQTSVSAVDMNTGIFSNATSKVVINGIFVDAVIASGLLGDELQPMNLGGASLDYIGSADLNTDFPLDARILPEGQADVSTAHKTAYSELQTMRAMTTQAIGALQKYAPTVNSALRGHMFALQGYAEVLLADIFCSGVPLTTLDFEGDYTYQPGSTTSELYTHAVTRFDSALALSADSATFLNLARVGQGRAFLALGRFADAAAAVAAVPDNFAYKFSINWGAGFGTTTGAAVGQLFTKMSVTASDSEGINGIAYRTSGDPRSAMLQNGAANRYGRTHYFPKKYAVGTSLTGTSAITVADGIEARLIQAEAALHAGDIPGWLTFLNRARTLAAPTLLALTDPGTDTARVTLLFRERALDLYVTGHRQGDLRRLIRQYGRSSESVYPTGAYPGYVKAYGAVLYGTDVDAPVPLDEQVNPLFHGCLDRGA